MQHLHLPTFLPPRTPYSALLPPKSSPIPILPSDSQTHLLIRITHCALNHVDLLYARGQHQNNRSLIRPPFTLGSEFAGVVLEAGEGAVDADGRRYRRGDEVFGGALGAFSTHVVCEVGAVRRVPAKGGWGLRECAGLAATLPVAVGALVKAAGVERYIGKGRRKSVLVHAAMGGIGVMLVQVARALGWRVLGTLGSAGKREICCRELGMVREDVVLYGKERKGWEKKVRERTEGGEGVDVVIDCVGLVEESIRCCRYGAKVVVVGFTGREGVMERLQVNRILLKGISVVGYRYGEGNRQTPGEAEDIWRQSDALTEEGLVKPVVYERSFRGLESIPDAMEAMADREVWGKAVIDLNTGGDDPSTGKQVEVSVQSRL